jgi:DNA-binding MarR family transcriptional regulator
MQSTFERVFVGVKKETDTVSAQDIARQCVAVRLRILTRAVTRIYNNALRPHGLNVSQMNILVAVACMKEAKQQDVCRALHMDKSTLSRDIERMRARAWLQTSAGHDGRTSLLSLTARGRQLLEKATPAWQKAQREAIALLGEKEVAAFDRATRTLRSSRSRGQI